MESEHCLSHRKHCQTHLKALHFHHNTFHFTHQIIPFTASSIFLLIIFSNTSSLLLASILLTLMAPPARSYHLHGLKLATIFTVLFIYFFCILFSKSGGSVVLERNESLEDMKMVIGSKPPACLHKCMNCRPCIATLVVPQKRKAFKVSSRGDDNDTYYLLAWRCRCGNKLFQP